MLLTGYAGFLTLACSTAMVAAFSASRCRRSFSLSEKIATDRALFTSFCLRRDFLAANSAAVQQDREVWLDRYPGICWSALLTLRFVVCVARRCRCCRCSCRLCLLQLLLLLPFFFFLSLLLSLSLLLCLLLLLLFLRRARRGIG